MQRTLYARSGPQSDTPDPQNIWEKRTCQMPSGEAGNLFYEFDAQSFRFARGEPTEFAR